MNLKRLVTAATAAAGAVLATLTMGSGQAAADVHKTAALYSVGNGPCVVDMHLVIENKASRPGVTRLIFHPSMRGLGDTCTSDVRIQWGQSQTPRPARGLHMLPVTASAKGNKPVVFEIPTSPAITALDVRPGSPIANVAGGSSRNDVFVIFRTV